MDPKAQSLLDKISHDKAKGHFTKALKKVTDGLAKYPDEIELYLEAADVSLESGESLQAVGFLKRALARFGTNRDQIDTFLREKVRALGDPVLGKFVLEQAVRDRAFATAIEGIEDLPSRAVRDLLSRTRTKRQSLTSPGVEFASNGKLIANRLCEALLCIRLGRLKDAMRSIVQILDEKPAEADQLEPFLEDLSERHPRDGHVRFAYSRALASTQHFDKAMIQLVATARFDPGLVDDCLEFIRTVSDQHPQLPETVDNALVELLFISGDTERAVGLLRERLESDPESAGAVMELVRQNVDSSDAPIGLCLLYVDAALEKDQPGQALEMMKRFAEDDEQRSGLYEWLEEKSMSCFLPPSILVFEGELAIMEGRFEKAVEIFNAVCGNSPELTNEVLSVVERNMKADESLVEFYHQYRQPDTGATSLEGRFDVQPIESSEFNFSSPATDLDLEAESSDIKLGEEGIEAEPGLDRFDGISSIPESRRKKEMPAIERLDLSGDESSAPTADTGAEAIVWDEEGEDEVSAGPDVEEREAAPARGDDGAGPAGVRRDDAPEITEEHVGNVARDLYASGAHSFFHVDENPETMEEAELSLDPANIAREQAELVDQYKEEAEADEEEHEGSFAARLALFRAGSLEGDAVLALLEEAFETGRIQELGELLEFEPRNAHELLTHKRYQAEYYILGNSPSAALDILETIDVTGLTDEQVRLVGMKTAVCHRMMSDYESANKVLLELAKRFPNDADVEQLARQNYEQFLRLQVDGSPALEKATFVAIDSRNTPRSKP